MYKYSLTLSIFFVALNTSAQQYIPKANMPTAKRTFMAAAAGGKIYVIGGANSSLLSTVDEYDPVTNIWTSKQNLPKSIHEGYAGAVDGKVYVIGGYDGSASNTVYEYNPATNTWASKATMPTPRATISGAVVNDKIYITGGWPNEYKKLEVYNPATNTWATKTDAPYGFLQNNGGTAVDSNFYVIGGRTNNYQTYYSHNLKYRTLSDNWDTMAPMPDSLYGGAAVTYNGKIHFFGGAYKNSPPSTSTGLYHPNTNTHNIYDPVLDSWTTGLSLPAKRAGHHAVEVNGKIYIIGGYDSSGVGGESNKVWEYSEATPIVCTSPDDTISNITHSSALIKWDTVSNAIAYEYSVITSSTPPVNGISTTNTQYPAGSLQPNTTYYVHLRAICNNDTSSWATTSFTTLPLSVHQMSSANGTISIYPNPATNTITVKTSDNIASGSIIITDITGAVVKKQDTNAKETTIDLNNIAEGIYLVRYSSNNNLQVVKLIKL